MFASPDTKQNSQTKGFYLDANHNRVVPKCDFCENDAKFACSRCESSWSCCELHGSYHQLPGACAPCKVRRSGEVGRFLIASRDIKAGEVLAIEKPLVVGPNQESAPICLGCLAEVDVSYLCQRCGYPMCDVDCSNSEDHLQECEILRRGPKPNFSDCSINIEAYHCIVPLRALLQQNPQISQVLLQFMDHRSSREGGEYWLTSQKYVVDFITNACQFVQFTQDEIHRIVGILEVNNFQLHSYGNAGYRGVFAVGSLMSHSCSANAKIIFGKEPPFICHLMASCDIPAGQEITTSYLDPLQSTLKRQHLISTGWYFKCICERCVDPTELETNLGDVFCPRCKDKKNSIILPSLEGDLICHSCLYQIPSTEYLKVLDSFSEKINFTSAEKRYDVDAWLQLIEEADKYYPKSHQVHQEISRWLIPILCRGVYLTFADFPKEVLINKLRLARRYLNCLDKVEPGLSRNRLKTLFEIVDVTSFIIQDNFEKGDKTSDDDILEITGSPISINKIITGLYEHLDEIEWIFSKIGANSGFEEWIQNQIPVMKERLCNIKLSTST